MNTCNEYLNLDGDDQQYLDIEQEEAFILQADLQRELKYLKSQIQSVEVRNDRELKRELSKQFMECYNTYRLYFKG